MAAPSAPLDRLEAQLAPVGPAVSDVRDGPVRVSWEPECAAQTAWKRVVVPGLLEGAMVDELAALRAVPGEPVRVVEELKDALLMAKHAAVPGPLAGLAAPESRDLAVAAELGRGVLGHSTSDAAPVEPDPMEELPAQASRDSVAAAGCGVPEYLVWDAVRVFGAPKGVVQRGQREVVPCPSENWAAAEPPDHVLVAASLPGGSEHYASGAALVEPAQAAGARAVDDCPVAHDQ